MNDDYPQDTRAAQPATNGDLLAELIRTAGRRESPPAEVYDQVYAAARQTWQAKLQAKRQRTMTRMAAALAVIGLAGAIYVLQSPAPSAQVATVARVIGMLETRPAVDMNWQPVGDAVAGLNRGGQLRTRAGGSASLRLDGGVSLRLAADTEIALQSAARVELRAGKLYVDTGGRGTNEPVIEIITPAGTARDVGTQFEVRYVDDAYRLRVREGEVLLLRSGQKQLGKTGEQLAITSRGELATTRVAPDDPDWRWVQMIAPAPSIEDQPLSVLLDWVARETGRPVRYQRPALQDKAGLTILHGNIRDLAPMDALGVVLATTDFTYDELDDGTIMIRLRTD